MKVTYRDLYTLTSREIDKRLQNISTSSYNSQLSRTSVSPLTSSSLVDVSIAELITAIQDLLSDVVGSKIITGLTVEATSPISSNVIIKAGTGTAAGKLYTLDEDTTIVIPLDQYNHLFFVSLYLDRITVDTEEDSNKLTIAKIVVPRPGTTTYIQNTKDESWNAYIISYKTYELHGDVNGKFEEDTIELLRDNISPILADNLIGNIRLTEDLKITNTAGTLELNSNSLEFNDYNEHTLARFNTTGIHFYDAAGRELARFTTDDAFIGNIEITKNALQSKNFVSGSTGFQLLDDGNVEFNNLTVRGTVYATAGEIGGWTIGDNEIYGTTTGTIKTSANAGSGYNGVVLDVDGLRVYDDVLGCVVNLPSDGSAPTFSSGTITSVTWELDTVSVIRTSDTVGDGSSSSAGILINNTGIYGCEANQTLAGANLKALIDGTVYLAGEINATVGNIGSTTITSSGLYGGLIDGSTIRAPVIETSNTTPKIRIDEDGISYQVTTGVGKYGDCGSGTDLGFYYGDGTLYGAGIYVYLMNVNYPPLTIFAEGDLADIRLYNRTNDPVSGSGPHEIGDLICVDGKLKICTVAGSPGTFTTVNANPLEENLDFAQYQAVSMVIENRIDDPENPVIGQIWMRID